MKARPEIENAGRGDKITRVLWKWTKRLTLSLLALVLLAVAAAATHQFVATRSVDRTHPAPGKLFDVGGHRLHLHSQGSGRPPVVIDAGLSGASYDWETVAKGISAFTTVCTYDRAGYGWSDPGPQPRTSQQVVAELRNLLRQAKIEPPFILLGHSWGGLNVRLYASLHPEDVAGLVLVDAVNTDLDPVSAEPGRVSALYTLLYHTAFLGPQRLVIPGVIREPADDARALEFRLAMLNRTKSARAIYEELTGEANWLAVRSAMKPLGDLPTVVITTRLDPVRAANTNDVFPGGPHWRETQEALLRISRRSRLVIAETTEHNIQFDEPKLIVDAVREMVESVRANRRASLAIGVK